MGKLVEFPLKEDERRVCDNCGWVLPHKFQLGIRLPPGAVLTIGTGTELSITLLSEFECPDCGDVFHVQSALGPKELTKK